MRESKGSKTRVGFHKLGLIWFEDAKPVSVEISCLGVLSELSTEALSTIPTKSPWTRRCVESDVAMECRLSWREEDAAGEWRGFEWMSEPAASVERSGRKFIA